MEGEPVVSRRGGEQAPQKGIKNVFVRLWGGLDNVLLVTVFVLLAVCWYSLRQSETEDRAEAAQKQTTTEHPPRNMPSAGRAVDSLRVSLEEGRMNRIARSMVEGAWERVPASPAMDMRENGKSFEIFFGLPDGCDEKQVKITARGNLLTLALSSSADGSIVLQRFRIPCGVAPDENVDTLISNNVLRVRIRPSASN